MVLYLWIGLGSALGGMARHGCGVLAARIAGTGFPWGTLAVNVAGSFLIGLILTISAPEGRLPLGHSARAFLMVGFCGGFTTFSSFSLQTLDLLREGEWMRAGANAVASFVLCLVAVWFGYRLGAGPET